MEILRDKVNRLLYLTQRNYVSEVLKYFDFNNFKSIKVPGQPGFIKDVNSEFTALKGVPVENSDIKLYHRIIRYCMYVITQTRLDIAFAVHFLWRLLQQPLSCHLTATKNLLRYLKGIKNLVINYGVLLTGFITDIIKDIRYNPLLLLRFNDNDFASNNITNKSTSGYLFTIAGGLMN